eukprot:7868045-Karenia_brevis.AAC.1
MLARFKWWSRLYPNADGVLKQYYSCSRTTQSHAHEARAASPGNPDQLHMVAGIASQHNSVLLVA